MRDTVKCLSEIKVHGSNVMALVELLEPVVRDRQESGDG